MSVLLTKEQLLQVKRRYAEVELPELGGNKVRLASFSARAAIRYGEIRDRMEKGEHLQEALTRLTLSAALVDEAGKPLFTEESVGELLDVLAPQTVLMLANKIGELNRQEPAPGNSEASPSAS